MSDSRLPDETPRSEEDRGVFYLARLKSLALSQLRVGALGFGGPLATMAMMRDELVDKKRLVTADRYLEGLGVVKLLPGPVSTLLAIFLGQEVAGVVGGLVSFLLFILPSFLMLLAIAYFEGRIADELASPVAQATLQALQAAVVAVILFNCYKLFIDAYRREYAGQRRPGAVLAFAMAAGMAAFVHLPELAILLAAAVGGIFMLQAGQRARLSVAPLTVFLIFLQAGVTVFGTGYMVLPYLQRVLVDERGWITAQAFLDGVTYGNLTPGPVVIASTFMGYKIAGLGGALAATAGIFAGPLVLMLSLGGLIRRMLGKPWVEGALLGLLPAVAATIAVSLVALGRAITWTPLNVAIGLLAFAVLVRTKVPTWMVLVASGLIAALVAATAAAFD